MRSKIYITAAVLCFIFVLMAFGTTNEKTLVFDNVPFSALSKPAQKQVECLAENIYFEAAHEPPAGKVAVALVTLNRLASGNYANSICDAVKQKTYVEGRVVCQFSWYCNHSFTSNRLTIRNTLLYNEIRGIAVYVLLNYDRMYDFTHGATYYHADYVNPGWKLLKTIKIGKHIFYKNKRDIIPEYGKEIRI